MVSKTRDKSTITPKELSKLLKERPAREFAFISHVYYKDWIFLLGGLITCPLCGREAVIVPYGINLPIREVHHIPCRCAVSLSSGKIYYHICIEDDKNNKRYFSIFSATLAGRHPADRFREHEDVCKLFMAIMKSGYGI